MEQIRIVVVDDNPDAAQTLHDVLQHDGYDVRMALSGAEAIAAVEQHRPLCVLMDLNMPGMSGQELARRLRARCEPGLVLIAVTGLAAAEYAGVRADGIDFVLTKPLRLDALRKLVPPMI